jgi:hypothetical protein
MSAIALQWQFYFCFTMIICVFFIFFSILAVSMATAPFWKNQPLKAQLHMAYDISTRLHKVYLDFFNFYIGGHFENFKNKEHIKLHETM